jgi:hypothetical protein
MDWAGTRRVLRVAVPTCFVLGAGVELFMQKVAIGGQTFYDVARRKKAERIVEELEEQRAKEAEREARRQRLRAKYGDPDVASGPEPLPLLRPPAPS